MDLDHHCNSVSNFELNLTNNLQYIIQYIVHERRTPRNWICEAYRDKAAYETSWEKSAMFTIYLEACLRKLQSWSYPTPGLGPATLPLKLVSKRIGAGTGWI